MHIARRCFRKKHQSVETQLTTANNPEIPQTALFIYRFTSNHIIFSFFIIGTRHVFQCIYICQVMFDRCYCIKSENICFISRYFLHYFVSLFHQCLANAIYTDCAHSRAGQYTSRNAANLWPWYDHIESCVDVH